MLQRSIVPFLRALASEYPVVVVTGPRQSGKTTLCRALFPDHAYANLEPADTRAFAQDDPRGFLARLADAAVIDEIQHVPELAGYLQEAVDEDPRPGRYVLTGSENLALTESVSQSLAGRCGFAILLPLSLAELAAGGHVGDDLWAQLLRGGFPRIFDRGLDAPRWLRNYLASYVERDVRRLLNVGDLDRFQTFVRLSAGRTGREVNLSSLGADAGVSHNTARSWLSVLQASFLVHTAPAWQRNLRKQLVKAPKLHWLDSGLTCALLGIREPSQLEVHPLRGAIFESWVASELLKDRFNQGLDAGLRHFRESRGVEIDVLIEDGLALTAVECKSGATVQREHLQALERFASLLSERAPELALARRLVYGGDEAMERSGVRIVGWQGLATSTALGDA